MRRKLIMKQVDFYNLRNTTMLDLNREGDITRSKHGRRRRLTKEESRFFRRLIRRYSYN